MCDFSRPLMHASCQYVLPAKVWLAFVSGVPKQTVGLLALAVDELYNVPKIRFLLLQMGALH